MVFEEVLEKVGIKVDKLFGDIEEKISKASKKVRTEMEKSRESTSEEIIKKMNKMGERISPDYKGLSNFERAASNMAIGLAHSLEQGYKKIKKEMFLTDAERKTRFGTLGKTWSEKYVPKERSNLSLEYAKLVEKKIGTKKLVDEILKDIVESLSTCSSELYGYYVYMHIFGGTRTPNHEEKKGIVKELLMEKGEREFYNNETQERDVKDKVRTSYDRRAKRTARKHTKDRGNKVNNSSKNNSKERTRSNTKPKDTIPNTDRA